MIYSSVTWSISMSQSIARSQAIRYALAKQIDRAYAISTDYGDVALDDELARAIDTALRPILERRLAQLGKLDNEEGQ